MRFKKGIEIHQLSPQMVLGCLVVYSALEDLGVEMIITSVSDGKHSKNSLHYKGRAIDIRTRHVSATKKRAMGDAIHKALGENFDTVVESDHIHIEYDPKG